MRPITLLIGILFPVATFLNVQGLSAWMAPSESDCEANTFSCLRIVTVLSSVSVVSGLLGTASLFLRMLEKKIKWSLIIFIYSAFSQAALGFSLSLFFALQGSLTSNLGNYNCSLVHGFVYSTLCGLLSILVGALARYKLRSNSTQNYIYNLYDLSPHQRQLVMVSISNFAFIALSAGFYSILEGWTFNDSVYFATSTYATIGLGDLVPTRVPSKVVLPICASIGIIILGSLVYSIRNVALELITFRLASKFSQQEQPHVLEVQHSLPVDKSPMLRPVSSHDIDDIDERHTDLQALDLAHSHSTFKISRSEQFPRVTIRASDIDQGRLHIIEVTRKVFLNQLIYASVALLLNIVVFGSLFTYLEDWDSVLDGFYFSYCVLTTIGFGDFRLTHGISRALFIWHVIFGITSMTYLSSLVVERALDKWTIEVKKIENRVHRYETKAKLKNTYRDQYLKSGSFTPTKKQPEKREFVEYGQSSDDESTPFTSSHDILIPWSSPVETHDTINVFSYKEGYVGTSLHNNAWVESRANASSTQQNEIM